MTTLTNEEIAEFRQICEEEGETVTMEDAAEGARRLLRLYELLLTPTPTEVRLEKLVELLREPGVREEMISLKRGRSRVTETQLKNESNPLSADTVME